MATQDVILKKRNAANNGWDTALPITVMENVMIDEQTSLAEWIAAIEEMLPFTVQKYGNGAGQISTFELFMHGFDPYYTK